MSNTKINNAWQYCKVTAMMCTSPHWSPLPGESTLKASYPFLHLFRCCWYPSTATPPRQHRRNCDTDEPQALLKASVGTARPESSGKWSSKLYKTALAATFTSFSSSLPLCKQQTCLTWLTKQNTWTHPTASSERRLCICRADIASDAGTGFIKTQKYEQHQWKHNLLCAVLFCNL